ncbi:MAG: hypothetical protein DMG22_15605 [Acidobacteria bacterium]|nr:MAG: hypothetical protein DMG22_15605 [Acidobacteriota bacterium]
MFFLTLILASPFGTALHAQDIRIKVLDGRNGRLVTNECVYVYVGKNVDPLEIPTNNDGMALLHLTNRDSATSIQHGDGPACRAGVVDPIVKYADTVGITSGSGRYMLCQRHQPGRLDLRFSVEKVLKSGDSTANVCGKIEASPNPGELIFFVRPATWWERMKMRD